MSDRWLTFMKCRALFFGEREYYGAGPISPWPRVLAGATGAIRIAGRAIATTADTGTRRRAFIAGAIIGGAIAAQPAPRAPSGSYHYGPAHVEWCMGRYRSYRASDNTFQPYSGRRQFLPLSLYVRSRQKAEASNRPAHVAGLFASVLPPAGLRSPG